jgi:hypothetical protein
LVLSQNFWLIEWSVWFVLFCHRNSDL